MGLKLLVSFSFPVSFIHVLLLSTGTGQSPQESPPEKAAPPPAPPWLYCPQRAGTPAARKQLTGEQKKPTMTWQASSCEKVGAAGSHHPQGTQGWCDGAMVQSFSGKGSGEQRPSCQQLRRTLRWPEELLGAKLHVRGETLLCIRAEECLGALTVT